MESFPSQYCWRLRSSEDPGDRPMTGCGWVFTTFALIWKALVTDHWNWVYVTRHLCLLLVFWLGLGSDDIMHQNRDLYVVTPSTSKDLCLL